MVSGGDNSSAIAASFAALQLLSTWCKARTDVTTGVRSVKTVVEMLAEMARRRVPVVSVARRLEVDPSTAYRWSEGTSLPRGENYAGLIQMYDEVMKSPPSSH